MIENIIFPVDLDQGAVGIPGIVVRVLGIRNARKADVAAADEDAAVLEPLCRGIAHRVAEVMAVEGAVDEIIFSVELPHGARLAEGLLLIGRALGLFAGKDADVVQLVAGNDGLHVRCIDLEIHRAVLRRLGAVQKDRIAAEGKAGVEIEAAVVVFEAPRIELEGLVPLADGRAVLVLHIVVELVFSGGLVADRDGDHLGAAHEIIEIIPAVGTHHHIGGRKAVGHFDPRSRRILLSAENDPVIRPVAQVVHRGGPAYIVAETEIDAVKDIVGAVDVDSAVHDVRFRIRNIFPAGKIGIECLLRLHRSFLSRAERSARIPGAQPPAAARAQLFSFSLPVRRPE